MPCFTPVQSPESNGIAEAFVKTFKRDYAPVHPLPDAATVLPQIAGWFGDYNENHPHSGLGMISPREFISCSGQVAGCPVKRGQHHIPSPQYLVASHHRPHRCPQNCLDT